MKVFPSETVSVVIPVYNQSQLTQTCLSSLLKHSVNVSEVMVVNNASKDQTPQVLDAFRERFQSQNIRFEIMTNETNLGFGRACNQGIRSASGDFVVILNNDTWLMPDWDRVLIEKLRLHSVACIGPYFYEKSVLGEKDLHQVSKQFTQKNKNKVRHHFVPILMMFTRKAVQALQFDHGGLFDERFFVTYEDTDLKERMMELGLNYLQTGDCFIWHQSQGTRSMKGALPPLYEQEGLRLFIEKWGFDPRIREHTFLAKLKRRWWKFKEKYGYF